MRLVARVDEGPPLHRIDALQLAEKVAALRNLKARRKKLILGLDCELARAGKNLPGHQERLDALRQCFPGERTGQKIVFVAAVAVAAEVGIVFVQADGDAALLGEMVGASDQNTLARAVVRDQFVERAAFRGAVFRVRMVVVKPRTVAQHEVAFDFDEAQLPGGVLGVIVRLVGVLPQFMDAKAAHVHVRVFAIVIPAHPDARFGGAAHQSD